MAGASNVPVVLAGLLAVLLLGGAVALAERQEEFERTQWVLMTLSAAGIAAAALFGGFLVIRLVIEIVRAMASL